MVSAGLALTCHDIDADGLARLRSSLTSGPRAGRVTSLQLRDLPASVSHLSSWMMRNLTLASLGVARSRVKVSCDWWRPRCSPLIGQDTDEDLFSGSLSSSLVTLALTHGSLSYVPRGINKITGLKSLDLTGNNIRDTVKQCS